MVKVVTRLLDLKCDGSGQSNLVIIMLLSLKNKSQKCFIFSKESNSWTWITFDSTE
jgi:hypothetical protein